MGTSISNSSRLTQYLDLHARRLRIDLEAARLYIGSTDIGYIAENAFRGFLRSVLPARYSVGVGEAIAPNGESPRRIEQTQQKDVLIFDNHSCSIFGWNDSEVGLVPVESLYGVIEVKTSISCVDDFLKAVDQTMEVRRLCVAQPRRAQPPPFAGVFVFDSKVSGARLFDELKRRPVEDRVDLALILNPNPSDVKVERSSICFAHWHYHSRGGGPIHFVTADETANERTDSQSKGDKLLTYFVSEQALLWFFLFLSEHLSKMQLTPPNLWEYAQADKQRLGWRGNESEI